MNAISLTADERHKLLAVLRELDEGAPAEKRRQARRKVQLDVPVRMVGRRPAKTVKSMLIDVSARGVALIVGQELEKGEKLVLPLRFREGGGWLILCEVRNASALPHGRCKVGAKIVDRIDDPEGNARPPMDWLI
jgi:hypothetical protein